MIVEKPKPSDNEAYKKLYALWKEQIREERSKKNAG